MAEISKFGSGLTGAAERIGARRARAVTDRLHTAIEGGLSGLTVERDDRGVTLAGRGLWRRRASDARLRWIGGWLR